MERPNQIELAPEMIRVGANIISKNAKDVQDGWMSADKVVVQV